MDFLRSSWLSEAKTSSTNTPGRFFFPDLYTGIASSISSTHKKHCILYSLACTPGVKSFSNRTLRHSPKQVSGFGTVNIYSTGTDCFTHLQCYLISPWKWMRYGFMFSLSPKKVAMQGRNERHKRRFRWP